MYHGSVLKILFKHVEKNYLKKSYMPMKVQTNVGPTDVKRSGISCDLPDE